MTTHLAKVTKRMGIYAKRRVRNVLIGNYGSVFKGRGMDFDDLRVYDYGDDIKDIDWKASARSRNLMIRRYVAIRKHNIMIVGDAGRNMAALTPSGERKSEVATFAAGVMAAALGAHKNDDLVGMTFGNGAGNTRFGLKEGRGHIENFLAKYDKAMTLDAERADMNGLLNHIKKSYRERLFLIIITDEAGAAGISLALVRKLKVRHEIMLVMIADSEVTNEKLSSDVVRDVVNDKKVPKYIRNNKKLKQAEREYRKKMREDVAKEYGRIGIRSCVLTGVDGAIPGIFRMLEEQKHARR